MIDNIRFEPIFFELFRALLWCAGWLLSGAGYWLLVRGRQETNQHLGAFFSTGTACCVPILIIGVLFGYPQAFAFVYIIIGIVLLVIKLRDKIRIPSAESLQKLRFSPWLILTIIVLAAPIVLALPVLLRPILSYDVLSYHLPLSHYLADGHLGYIEGNYYSRLPLASFLLYIPLLSDWSLTFDDPGIRIFILFAWIAGASLAAALARHLGAGLIGQVAAAAFVMWHPMAWNCLYNGYSDILVMTFALAGFERLLASANSRRWLFMSGYFAGLAVAVKFSAAGIVAVPLIIAAIIIRYSQKTSPLTYLKSLAMIVLGMTTAYFPWTMRSIILGGHPLHPFAGSAPGWTTEQAQFLLAQHQPRSILSAEYYLDYFRKLEVFGFDIPILRAGLLVAALLLLLWTTKRKLPVAALLLAATAGYCAWLTVAGSPSRFVFPVIGLICAMGGALFAIRPDKPAVRFAQVAIAVALCLALLRPHQFPQRYMLGFYAEAWDRQQIVSEDLIIAARSEQDANGKLLLLFEARQRWFPNSTMTTAWDAPNWAETLKNSASAEEFASSLRKEGYTHLLVNEFEFARIVDFYGGREFAAGWGSVGIQMPEEEYISILSDWPSSRFARFSREDLARLREFLLLSRSQPNKIMPAGPVARLWLSPIPDNSELMKKNETKE